MEITITKETNATIIVLNGSLDANTAPLLEQQLQNFLISPSSNLVFNFHQLDYISSAGLRVILNTAKAYKTGPYRFVTCSMQDHILEIFEISGFDSFIPIHRSVEDSLAVLKESP